MTYLEMHAPAQAARMQELADEVARLARVARAYIDVHAEDAPAYYTPTQWARAFRVDPAELAECVLLMECDQHAVAAATRRSGADW